MGQEIDKLQDESSALRKSDGALELYKAYECFYQT